MDGNFDLLKYQVLLVGLIGFFGVCVTLFFNAYLARAARREIIEHDRLVIRAAIIEELMIMKLSCEENFRKTANPPQDANKVADVPNHDLADAYKTLLNKIGLFKPDEISKVMLAYLKYRQLIHIASNVLNKPDAPVGRIQIPAAKIPTLHGMYGDQLNAVNAALEALTPKA